MTLVSGRLLRLPVGDAEDLERCIELAEDMADIARAEQAREEMGATGGTPVPGELVKADLGLARARPATRTPARGLHVPLTESGHSHCRQTPLAGSTM